MSKFPDFSGIGGGSGSGSISTSTINEVLGVQGSLAGNPQITQAVNDVQGLSSPINSLIAGTFNLPISPLAQTLITQGGLIYQQYREGTVKPNPVNIGGPLKAMAQRQDPLISVDWYIALPTLPGVSTDMNNYVESVNPAPISFQTKPVYRAAGNVYYPIMKDVNQLELTFYEDINNTAQRYLETWRSLIRNPNGTYNLPVKYKQGIIVYAMDRHKQRPTASILVIGCFPVNFGSYQFESGTANQVKVTATMSIDHVEFRFQ